MRALGFGTAIHLIARKLCPPPPPIPSYPLSVVLTEPKKEEIQKMINDVDNSGDGEIDFDE